MTPLRTLRGQVIRLILVAIVPCLLLLAMPPRPGHAAPSGSDYYSQGVTAAKQGHYPAAVHDFEQALLLGHTDANTFYQLGMAYRQTRQLGFAAWAVATALSDDIFSAAHPDVVNLLNSIEGQGGLDKGAPPRLQKVTLTRSQPSVAQVAQQEASAAYAAFQQDANQAYFVAPGFSHTIGIPALQTLVDAVNAAADHDNTSAKFVFLDGTPAPYATLTAYAKDLLLHLKLVRGVVVVVTPQQVAATTGRLDEQSTAAISASVLKSTGLSDPAPLAIAILQGILQKASDNDRSATIRSALIGGTIVLVLVALLGVAIIRILRPKSMAKLPGAKARGYPAPSKRVR